MKDILDEIKALIATERGDFYTLGLMNWAVGEIEKLRAETYTLRLDIDECRAENGKLRTERDKAHGAGVKETLKSMYDGLDPDTRAMLV